MTLNPVWLVIAVGLSYPEQSNFPAPSGTPQVVPGASAGRPQDLQPPQQGGRPLRSRLPEAGPETSSPTRELLPLKHPRDKTMVVEIKHAKPDLLAKSLQKAYGETLTAEVAAGTPVPAILLSGTEKGVQEAKQILEQLDKPGKTYTMELTVLESSTGDDMSQLIATASGGATFTDASWQSLVKKLQSEGKISSSRFLELKSGENQPARTQVGEDKPLATGSMMNSRGLATRNYSFRSVGTMANITLRQPKDGEYLADIKLEDSRVNLGKNSPAPDKEKDKEKPEEFKPDSIVTFTTEITVSMALGKVVPIKVNQEWEKTSTRQVLVYLRIKNS